MIKTDIPAAKLVGTGIEEAWVNHNPGWDGSVYIEWIDNSGQHVAPVPGVLLRVVCRLVPSSRFARRKRYRR